MTLAVLTSTGTTLDPADSARLAEELSGALRAAGASTVESGPSALRDVAERAQQSREAVLICAGNLVAHPSLLWMLATEPAGRTTALVVPDPGGDLRDDRGKVLPATDIKGWFKEACER